MADNKLFKLKVIAPERVFFEGDVDMVETVTTEGEIGILKGHIPLTAVIAPGVLKIHTDGEIKIAALHGGFMEILKDEMLILAEVCEWPDEIDLNRANEAKIRAERRLKENRNEINVTRAELALNKSLVRIKAAEAYRK